MRFWKALFSFFLLIGMPLVACFQINYGCSARLHSSWSSAEDRASLPVMKKKQSLYQCPVQDLSLASLRVSRPKKKLYSEAQKPDGGGEGPVTNPPSEQATSELYDESRQAKDNALKF
ncbi:unnamed protein product, partial [Heterosigma akashiwo]